VKALIQIEFFKLFKQSRTYYALASLFGIELIILASAYFQGKNILDILLENLQKNFYFEGTLLNGNLLIYLILNTQWFHLPLILMIVLSGIITNEYKDRTIQTMLLQPVKKWQLILSKYIVAIIFTILAVAFLAITSFSLCYGIFGRGDLIVYLNTLNFFTSSDATTRLLYAFGAGTCSMIFFTVVSITIGIFLKDAAKTWIVSAFFLIISHLLLKVDLGNQWLNTLLFMKLSDTWQYFFYTTIPWHTVYQNTLLSVGYIIILVISGVLLFHKKDIG
jgi:ABC-2 type transport system permease protein